MADSPVLYTNSVVWSELTIALTYKSLIWSDGDVGYNLMAG